MYLCIAMLLSLAIFLGVFNSVLIPIQFKDRDLQCSTEQLETLAADAQAYFNRQYDGEKTFNFQLCSPVSLPEKLSYYGNNSISRKDELFHEAVVRACREVNQEVDFKTTDNILLLCAGPGEDEGAGQEYIWPHYGLLSEQGASFRLDGRTIDSYTVCTELCNGEFTGIGKICHETGHALGLPDLYDTDGEGSGGRSDALGGSLALMDKGYLNGSGHNPPDFTAIEREIAGTGTCIEMKSGTFELNHGHEYLRAEGTSSGEYYLAEYVDGRGITLYHIDKSENPAGLSSMQGKELTAEQRWTLNEVNCNPDHLCASLAEDFPWCIIPLGDNKFEVLEPLSIEEMEIYQDGMAVSFTVSEKLEITGSPAMEIICGADTLAAVVESADGKFRSVVADDLQPSTQYRARISFPLKDGGKAVTERDFTTKHYREDSIPFIVLRSADRNSDGSFSAGAVFPLKVYNAPETLGTIWYFNGKALTNKWFRTESSGTLKAEVILKDGTTDFIIKEISVK